MTNKKSIYRHVVINKKKYYFYKITWADITGDSGHATAHEFSNMKPSIMITHAYVYEKDNKNIRTFGSYEHNDELFLIEMYFQKVVLLKWKGY
jgi:hypothetical protein